MSEKTYLPSEQRYNIAARYFLIAEDLEAINSQSIAIYLPHHGQKSALVLLK